MLFAHRLKSALICALAVYALIGAGNASAAEDEVFEVRNIAVDVKAETAAEARAQALREAEQKAFKTMLARLTLRQDRQNLPTLSRTDIAGYVRDFSVAQEKASSVRYIARLNYRFKPEPIRELLRAYNVPFAETSSKPMLVLPVFENAASTVLWDEPNPWRLAWQQRDAPDGLVPLIVPIGDLNDIVTIGAADALAGSSLKLATLADRYAATGSIVAHLNLTVDPTTGAEASTITLLRPFDPIPVEARSATLIQLSGEDMPTFMARAVEDTVNRIDDLWKRRNLISNVGTGVMAITVPIGGLTDWLQIKKQLASIGIIRRTEIVLLSREQVRVNVHFAGGAEQLTTALEQANLSLLQESGEWLVMPIGAFQPPKG